MLDSNCYISAHVSQIRLLACFLHGHNVRHIFSERLARGEPGQAGNSWWLRIRFGPGEWSRLGRAASGAREKSSAALHTSSLTHREKNPHRSGGKRNVAMFYKSMLWRFVRVYQLFLSRRCEMFSKGHPADGQKKKNDMNAKLSNIVDGKSMTCMQLFNSSSATTVRDNAWTEISTEPEKMKDFRRKVLIVEEDGSRHTTHANIVYNWC